MTLDRQEIENILFMGHLKCLFLGIGRQDTIDLSSSLKVVQNFRRNQGAISSGIDFRSLRSLRVLGLDLSPGMAIGPAGTLDSLEELILKGPAKLITEFLGTILVPQLASVRLFVADSPRSERLLKIFSFLGHHALKIIAVCALGTYEKIYTINWNQIFAHLSGLAELEALRLQFYQVSISMDDHDMARLAQTWQSLKILDLRHCETSTSRLPSMKSLVQVAENAPKLRELYLDIQNNIDSLLPLECAVFNHQLQILDLYFHWKDPKSEIGSMANFFHSLFPCLDTRGLVGDDQRWTEMLRLIDEKRGSRQLEK
ncbi:hypothetical protein GLOTRDRAFT_127603 [Gloeophyllum trabeum ATCC 11539]|uniref:RNI-like protein n=1 Tax=Gloeophyllum trabeum (strain ATCC 11539 / FP-39264 / Madison 617) TaxID=670483 RepID=S7QD12_GLOTA|nr:uncharacterized protein GLOTRDRAFT_127603 [Gloeophyllum trabeum ATCC 11539]EPQ57237.1 hypothetical protein GLOTRDRAFT_127603 [Gloeophyllum trabeum ATCC 11539]